MLVKFAGHRYVNITGRTRRTRVEGKILYRFRVKVG